MEGEKSIYFLRSKGLLGLLKQITEILLTNFYKIQAKNNLIKILNYDFELFLQKISGNF